MRKSGAKTESILNQNGVDVIDTQGTGEDLLYAGYVDEQKAINNTDLSSYEVQTVVYSKNMIVKNYLTVGTKSRFEDYEDGTGIFII